MAPRSRDDVAGMTAALHGSSGIFFSFFFFFSSSRSVGDSDRVGLT
jgi:hypothetical protein